MADPTEALEIQFVFRNERYLKAEMGLQALSTKFKTSPKRLSRILRRNLLKYLRATARGLSQRHGSPYPGGTGPHTLSKRSGRAVRSILASPKVYGNTSISSIRGEVGGVGYLRSHEFGAKIRPKKAQYLTIPLPAALNPNGTPKRKSAKDWPDTFVITSKAGNKLIVRKKGTGIEPLYVLKKEVVIKPRLGMRQALQDNVDYFIDTVANEMHREILK